MLSIIIHLLGFNLLCIDNQHLHFLYKNLLNVFPPIELDMMSRTRLKVVNLLCIFAV